MELATLGWLLAGLGVALVWATIWVIMQYLVTLAVASKASNSEQIMQQMVRTSAYTLASSLVSSSAAVVSAFIVATLQLVQTLYRNRLSFAFSIVVFVFLLVVYFLQVPATETAVIGYQVVVVPTLHKLIYPLLNTVSMLGSIVVAGLNWITQVVTFLMVGIPKIIIGCLLNQDIYSLFVAIMNVIFASTSDLVNWIIANPIIARYDTIATTTSIGLLLAQTTGVGNCTCAAVFFIYEDAVTLVNTPEFVVTFDSAFNALLSIIQRFTPLPLLFGEDTFTLDPFAVDAPIAINGLGDVVILALKLLANSIYGFFDTQNQLPEDIQDFLSQPLLEPGTQLVSGIVILLNITLEVTKNPYNIYTGPTTGLPYFQFGKVIDRIRLAVRALGSYFILLGPNVVDAVTKTLLIPVGLTAFVAEFIPDLIYYIFYPPVQNPLQFMLIYYQNPNNELRRTFVDAYLAAEEIGLVIKLVNIPTGDLITGILSSFIALLQIITDIIFFSYNLFGFENATPTYTDISTNDLFASLILTNAAMGDFFRQFDPDFCFDPNSVLYTDDTAVCAFANAGSYFFDAVISILINVVRFLQTFLAALREPSPDFSTVDIPEFDVAITNAERSGCSLATAVVLLIPFELDCQFSDTNAASICATGQTCAASVLCEIWQTLLSLLRIANDFFIKLREGGQFETFTDFFSSALKQFVDDALAAFRSLGVLLDCLICRVVNPGGMGCDSVIFKVFDTLATAIGAITEFVTGIVFDVINLIFSFIKSFFIDGNFIGAVIDFTIGVVGIILKAAQTFIQFLIEWLEKVGLKPIAAVFKVFDFAFCSLTNGFRVLVNFLTAQPNTNLTDCSSLEDLKRTSFQVSSEGDTLNDIPLDILVGMFPGKDELPTDVSWRTGSNCFVAMNDVSTLDEFESTGSRELVNEGLYCAALLYWDDYLETTKHQRISFENVCDYVMTDMHRKQPDWQSLSSVDRGITIQCIQQRYFMDFIRNTYNVTFLPRDLRSNPLRLPFYASGILLEFYLVSHYYKDHKSLPGEIRQTMYINSLEDKGANTSYITANEDMPDNEFGHYLDTLTLQDYMTMNDVTYRDEILLLDEFGRTAFNGGINAIVEMIQVGTGELEVGMGTSLLGSTKSTSQSISTLISRIMYNTYKVVTVGAAEIAGTPEKRAILADGGVRMVEGFGYLVSGMANVTSYSINSYGKYRDRLSRIAMGTATQEDREIHTANEVWWDAVKEKTFPWRWSVYSKPAHSRAHEQKKMQDSAACRGNNICDINSLALSMNVRRNSARRMHPRQKSIGEHLNVIQESIDHLRTPTPEAAARYNAFTGLFTDSMDYFYMGYSGGMRTSSHTQDLHFRAPVSGEISLEAVHATSTMGYVTQSIFIGPPVCLTNYTDVCEKCIVLENGIANVLQASGNLIAYINGPFQSDMEARRDFLAYAYDDNAPVRVGERPGLPVWFPLPTVNSYHYVGPPENITMIGFSDYEAITSVIPSTDGIIRDNLVPGSIYYATFTFFDSFARPLISRIEGLAPWISSGTDDGTAPEISLFGKLLDDIWTCDYGPELDGTEQRFSTPIALVITIFVLFLVRALIQLVFDANGFISNLLPSFMIAIYVFLYLNSNWSISCFPALPLSLSRQLFETIAYTFFPKCLYYVSGLLEEGHYHSELFCSSVDLVSEVRAYSCRADGQFNDIFAHVAFITVNFWPTGISFLQGLPYIGGYVDTYLAVDMTDRVLYSFSHTCNVWFGIVNFGLVIFGLFTASFLARFLLALVQVAAIPILLIGDIYSTAFLAISETDYLMSIVADRERYDDRQLVGESGLPDMDQSLSSSIPMDDGFVTLSSPIPFGDTTMVPLETPEEDDVDNGDNDEKRPMLRVMGKKRKHKMFGLRRPDTAVAKNPTPYDRL